MFTNRWAEWFVGEGLGGRNGRSDDQPLVMTNSRPSDWPALPAMLEQNASHFGARAALLSDGDEPLSHQIDRLLLALEADRR